MNRTKLGIPRTAPKSITELREVFKRHGFSLKTKDCINGFTLRPCKYTTYRTSGGGSVEFFDTKGDLQDYADQIEHMAMLMAA